MRFATTTAVAATAAFAGLATAYPFVQRDVVKGSYDFVVVGGCVLFLDSSVSRTDLEPPIPLSASSSIPSAPRSVDCHLLLALPPFLAVPPA